MAKFFVGVVVLVGLTAAVLYWSSDWGAAFGGRIEGKRLERVNASPRFIRGRAQNSVPTDLSLHGDSWELLTEWFRGAKQRRPPSPVPLVIPDPDELQDIRSRGIRFVWLGHSTVYLEIDGNRVLIDPVWADRASPFTVVGPRRNHPVPIALSDLPRPDVVVISHDHYDHLDMNVIRALAPRGTVFAVPLGVGAHLEAWGVPKEQMIELDWWEGGTVGSLGLIATSARHFSGRRFVDSNRTLWASWTLIGPASRVFYSGDTGWLDDFKRIGDEYGPFDLTMIKCGAYNDAWPDIHIDGSQAVDANVLLEGRLMLPVHWLTFDLALHPWDEPVRHAVERASEQGVEVLTPRVGELIDLGRQVTTDRWYEELE